VGLGSGAGEAALSHLSQPVAAFPGAEVVLPPTLVRGLRKFPGGLSLVGEGRWGQVSQG
jgi:hypothetical protein